MVQHTDFPAYSYCKGYMHRRIYIYIFTIFCSRSNPTGCQSQARAAAEADERRKRAQAEAQVSSALKFLFFKPYNTNTLRIYFHEFSYPLYRARTTVGMLLRSLALC